MLRWALIFLAVALVTAVLGFTSAAGASIGMAKILFYVFATLFLVSLAVQVFRGRPTP